ncbi:hypothetical protein D3C71_2092640 [compost metagenome]
MNDSRMRVRRQRLVQNRQQTLIDLHGQHTASELGQLLCKRADTGADFERSLRWSKLSSHDDFAQNILINQEVLT